MQILNKNIERSNLNYENKQKNNFATASIDYASADMRRMCKIGRC